MILASFLDALAQMGDRRFVSVLVRGVGLTLALLIAFYIGVGALVDWLVPAELTLPLIGKVDWIARVLSGGSVILAIIASVFLMVPVASAFTGIFLDDVAEAVEARHYPALPPAPRIGWGEMLGDSARFLLVVIGANLLALIGYLLAGPLAPVLFYALNGYLLGREYFQMAAMRRAGRAGAEAMRRRNGGQVFVAGLLMALPLTVPLVNLLVPVLAAATFTHLYHRIAAAEAQAPASAAREQGWR